MGLLVAFLVAAFCSGVRRAFEDVDPGEVGAVAGEDEGQGSKISTNFQWWEQRRRSVSIVLAVASRLAVICAVVLAVLILNEFMAVDGWSLAGLVVAMTLLMVLLADVVPTAIARSNPRRFALWGLRVLRLPYVILYPLTRLFLGFRRLVVAVVGEAEQDRGTDQSRARQMLLKLMGRADSPASSRRFLMRSVVEFPATIVREVMVPRTDMVAIKNDMELDEILVRLLECGHSRLPVYGETLDDIDGLFYAKDIIQLMASGRDFEIEDYLRQTYFVPETKPISDLLTEFQRERIHLAVVVDEFGGTAGLITLEDIIEEFFGDIQDEYDVEPSQLIELSDNSVLADARIGIDEIEEYFQIEMPREGEYDSLGGFLLAQTGAVPAVGDEIEWECLRFRVMEANVKRIDTVEIEIIVAEIDEASRAVS